MGYFVFVIFGFRTLKSLLVATTLTATSIGISVQVLTELGKMQSKESRLILGAAIVDDIFAHCCVICGYYYGTDRKHSARHFQYHISRALNFRSICCLVNLLRSHSSKDLACQKSLEVKR